MDWPPPPHTAHPPPDGPPPWPPPLPAWSPPDTPPRRRRRWPVAGLVVVALLTAALGVAGGAAQATSSAASAALRLEASGHYGSAIALEEVIASRTGPLYALDSSAAAGASRTEDETLLAWASAFGRAGKIDEAVLIYRSVPSGPLRTQAIEALATLLYASARNDVAHGEYPSAILRLEEIATLAPQTDDGRLAGRQLPIDQAGEARQLLAAGHGADAVATLDAVVKEGSAQATQTADGLYPAALLIAGQDEMAEQSYKEALADLQRLVGQWAGSAQALQAQAMLSAPETVSGTLVDRNGAAAPGPVRLSTNYKAEPGGTYKTSGPFILATADAQGDFTFSSVPIGGPYVLEVFTGDSWTTLIDPSSGQPAHPVKVTALVPVDLTFVVLAS
jgi:tetratricopeptide (TPR) repeat protein